MSRRYDIEDKSDLKILNTICGVYGIHFEKDLLDRTYVLVDHKAYFPEQQEYAKRKRKKSVQP